MGKDNYQIVKMLVTSKFDNWKKAIGQKGQLQMHAGIDYHKTCQYQFNHFLAVQKNKVDSIEVQLNQH